MVRTSLGVWTPYRSALDQSD